MTTRADVVRVAREWLGTPYLHQHRAKGVGVDCAGLLIGVARELGLTTADFDIRGYARQPDGSLMSTCGTLLLPIRVQDMQPGDLVAMRFEDEPCHLAIVGDYPVAGHLSLIHALGTRDGHGRVVEHRLDERNRAKVVGAFKFPGVE